MKLDGEGLAISDVALPNIIDHCLDRIIVM
jgi:hypothetical protein